MPVFKCASTSALAYRSVIPYPAIVVGLPVNEANDCAGTLEINPESLVH